MDFGFFFGFFICVCYVLNYARDNHKNNESCLEWAKSPLLTRGIRRNKTHQLHNRVETRNNNNKIESFIHLPGSDNSTPLIMVVVFYFYCRKIWFDVEIGVDWWQTEMTLFDLLQIFFFFSSNLFIFFSFLFCFWILLFSFHTNEMMVYGRRSVKILQFIPNGSAIICWFLMNFR